MAGLGITGTTIAGFVGYDVHGMPEFIRARKATQYANNIDQWVKLVNEGNNGGYANIWLLCNINTGEIARFEQGLKHQELLESTNGFYYGCNACHNPRIRNLECVDNGYNVILVNKLVHVEHALKNYYQRYLGQLMMALLRES